MEIKLGKEVIVTTKYTRKWKHDYDGVGIPIMKKFWEREQLKQPLLGIIVGERTLSNGETYDPGDNKPKGYDPKEYFKAILVSYSLHRNPILVPIN